MSRALLAAVAAVAVAIVAALAAVSTLTRGGLSTHDDPTSMEAALARRMRGWSVPADLRDRKNPVEPTPEVLAEARAHFADHCATCHGNDGKGSDLGRRMYPKAPDMTADSTQSLSDGALFAVIENGIRLTGMPGFGTGTAESAYGSWSLVHFVRHLPRITPEELREMQRLNPKAPAEWLRMQQSAAPAPGSAPTPAPASDGHAHQH